MFCNDLKKKIPEVEKWELLPHLPLAPTVNGEKIHLSQCVHAFVVAMTANNFII